MTPLQQAQANERNFAEYCRWMEKRWGPHGTEHKWRRQLEQDKKAVAAYYARRG